ncbi:hypothetical protein [Halobacteriovorax sp. RT-1-4]|uniref:hypothetical protein n=1 Tax=unclassified Halobacteriovorax TaxID=2639665 RepID=UPI0039994CCC
MKFEKSNIIPHLQCILLIAICLFRSVKVSGFPIFPLFVITFSLIAFQQSNNIKKLLGRNKELIFFLLVNLILLVIFTTEATYVGHAVVLPLFLVALREFFREFSLCSLFRKYLYYSTRIVALIIFIPLMFYLAQNFDVIINYINDYNDLSTWVSRSKIIINAKPFFIHSPSATIEVVFFIIAGSIVEIIYNNNKKTSLISFILLLILRARSLFVSMFSIIILRYLFRYKSKKMNFLILTSLLSFPVVISLLPNKILSGRHLGREVFLNELSFFPSGIGFSARALELYSSNAINNNRGYPVMRVFDNIHYELITDYGILLYAIFLVVLILKFLNDKISVYNPSLVFFFVTLSCSFGSNFYPIYIFILLFLNNNVKDKATTS